MNDDRHERSLTLAHPARPIVCRCPRAEPNRQTIDAVTETQKRTAPTLRNVAEAYQKTTKQNINEEQLLQKLAELEETGIIASSVNSSRDEPIQTWNAHV